MKCSFCAHELTLEMVREQGCGGCLSGCRKVHCPYCGQENPMVPEFLEKLLKSSKNGKPGS